jgi:hypothetical protein
MSNNKIFNVKGNSTIKYPRFKNPVEYIRNLSNKYGNKSVTYLEYILGFKDNTYSNYFKKIYSNNFTVEYNGQKIFDFNNIPDVVKINIITTCMENQNSIYSKIPDFIRFKNNLYKNN